MVQQPRRRLSIFQGHVERPADKVPRHPAVHRPAHDFPREQVDRHGQIEPTFARPDVRDVRDPEAVRRRDRKIPVEQVVGHRKRMTGIRRHPEPLLLSAQDTVNAHKPFHAVEAGPHPIVA